MSHQTLTFVIATSDLVSKVVASMASATTAALIAYLVTGGRPKEAARSLWRYRCHGLFIALFLLCALNFYETMGARNEANQVRATGCLSRKGLLKIAAQDRFRIRNARVLGLPRSVVLAARSDLLVQETELRSLEPLKCAS